MRTQSGPESLPTKAQNWSTEADWDGGDDGYLPVSRLRQQYLDYIGAKVPEFEEQRQARHYYHGAQWDANEVKKLRERKQPIGTFNLINRKIDAITGLCLRLRQDPKAYPAHPKDADAAEVATQSVRTVLEENHWYFLDSACCAQGAIEGIAGVGLKLVQGDQGDPDVALEQVYGEDFFYDPRSVEPDFSDARWRGIAKWLDIETAIEMFPDKETELRSLLVETGFDLTTHADREIKWVYVNEERVRLVEHWYRHKGEVFWSFYVSAIVLDQGESPFKDEKGKPVDRFEMFSAGVDHELDRYGFIRTFKSWQDEYNHRHSKALHISNVTRLTVQKGSVDDVERTRLEAARPDGVVEYNPGFEPPVPADKTGDLAAQWQLMQEAAQGINSFANINPAMMAQDDTKDRHSGVAINLLQKAGIAELGTFLRNYRAWKIRVYRLIWNTVQEHWKSERWLRVTDNDGVKQFLSVNKLGLDQYGQPIITNVLGSLDVDIILDEGPDVANLMQDAYEMVADDPTVPWNIKLELMPMPASIKKTIQEKMQQAAQQQGQDPKVQAEQIKAQAAAASSQSEIQRAQVQAQAEIYNAQQDAQARQQDAALQREREAAEREKMAAELQITRVQAALDMEQARQMHAFKMQELQAKMHTMRQQHELKRKQMAQQSKAKAKPKGKAA